MVGQSIMNKKLHDMTTKGMLRDIHCQYIAKEKRFKTRTQQTINLN